MTTIEDIIEFYGHSNADVLEAMDGEGAGVIWTIPPCSPEGLKQGIRQLIRSKATKIRWIRKVRLNSRSAGPIEAVAIYRLPGIEQQVFRLDTGEEIVVGPLRDTCLMTS